MFDNSVLNVVISLTFIFLLYSLFATALQEALANLFQRRARMLFKGIKTMLSNTPDRRLPVSILLLDKISFGLLSSLISSFYNKKKPIKGENVKDSPDDDKEKETINSTHLPTTSKRLISRHKKREDHLAAKKCLYDRFYDHPIIKNYGQNDFFSKPSYLTDKNFSAVLTEVIKDLDENNKDKTATFDLVKKAFDDNNDNIEAEVVKIINYHLKEAAGDLDVFKYRLEKWFNDSMDRVSGWYKRNTQLLLFIIGLFLAITINVDSIEITSFLSKHKQAAEMLSSMGAKAVQDSPTFNSISKQALEDLKKEQTTVNTLLGLGWGDYGARQKGFIDTLKQNKPGWFAKLLNSPLYNDIQTIKDTIPSDILSNYSLYIKGKYMYSRIDATKFFGFFITAIAISLGAPFWFDLLNKFVNLRAAGKAVDPSGSTTRNNISENNEIDG
jgi:hypothetical protein